MKSRSRISTGLAMAAALSATFLSAPPATLAQTAPQNATVVITDTGFSPPSVTIPIGGSVTWQQTGDNPHAVSQLPGSGAGLNSTVLTNGQSFSFSFQYAGTYSYTSWPDCLGGSHNSRFDNCNPAVIYVGGGAPAAATAQPAATGPVLNGNVTITDNAFTPTGITIIAGGAVTWTNSGQLLHTATQTFGSGYGMDSGGIVPGQSFTFPFPAAGIYYYTSAADCLAGNNNITFGCSVNYFVSVLPPGTVPVPAATAAPVATVAAAPAQAASAVAPKSPTIVGSASPSPRAAAQTNATVTITDTTFAPATVTIIAGGSITWINNGQNTHSATQVPGSGYGLDSGGLGGGQSFSFLFPTAGTFFYSSAPDCLNANTSATFNCPASYIVNVVPAPAR